VKRLIGQSWSFEAIDVTCTHLLEVTYIGLFNVLITGVHVSAQGAKKKLYFFFLPTSHGVLISH
jgi:hypothetical protein